MFPKYLLFPFSLLLLLVGCSQEVEHPEALSIADLFQFSIQGQYSFNKLENAALQTTSECLDADSTSIEGFANEFHKNAGELFMQKKYKAAEIFYQQAIALRKSIYPDTTHIDILRAKHNLAYARMQRIGDFQEALDNFSDIPDKLSFQNVNLYFANNTRIGFAFWKLGDFILAKRYFNKALIFYNQSPELVINNIFVVDLFRFYSACLRENNELKEAIKFGEKALHFVLDKNLQIEEGATYLVIGNAWQDSLQNIKDVRSESYRQAQKQAIFYTQKALEKYKQSKQIQPIILTITNLGEIYRRTAQYLEAEKTLREGIAQAQQYKVPGEMYIGLFINLGEVHYDKGNYDKAIACYQRANTLLRKVKTKSFEGFRPMEGTIVERLTLLSDLPEAYLAKYRNDSNSKMLELAASHYDTLFEQINFLRGNIISDQSKIELAQKAQKWIGKAFTGNMNLYSLSSGANKANFLEKAFQLSEQSKSFALLEATRLQNISRFLPRELREEEKKLMQIAASADLSDVHLEEFEKAKRQYLKHLKEQKPEYFALKYKGPDLSISDIQQILLEKDQAMLAYYCQDSVLFSFYFDSNGHAEVDSKRISKENIQKNVGSILELLNNPSNADGTISVSKDSAFLTISHSLYELLFSHKWLGRLPKRLIIIPDDVLYRLPFDVLTTIPAHGETISEMIENQKFTLFKYAFSYCFSANVLMEMQKKVVPSILKRHIAILAPAGKEENVSTEVKEIEKLSSLTTHLFKPEESTKENFWKACNQYAYVHVAAHGFILPNPESNYIRLWPSKKDPKDTSLFLNELYKHSFQQEMIDLSACQTASGPFQEGEGNISLARGLAYGGTRSILSTLWEVPTEGKSYIMPHFYAQLDSLPKDVALQKAKCIFLERSGLNPYPQNWAGHILIGTSNTSKKSPTYIAIFLMVCFALIAWTILHFGKKR